MAVRSRQPPADVNRGAEVCRACQADPDPCLPRRGHIV